MPMRYVLHPPGLPAFFERFASAANARASRPRHARSQTGRLRSDGDARSRRPTSAGIYRIGGHPRDRSLHPSADASVARLRRGPRRQPLVRLGHAAFGRDRADDRRAAGSQIFPAFAPQTRRNYLLRLATSISSEITVTPLTQPSDYRPPVIRPTDLSYNAR